ncbi:hypothetical protein KKA93_01035 [Patescibacteria group bacterium]|nr:hypothetical protein [Patescibacteria group bacterium]MBU1663567.1 hypothetical protein [Patescibacteria group bacterium]MBU1934195.1 hypothetical protein [Patescibacteria group bacterium]MBU2007591.1 hypothetical protein [Patescibacteria group bacterium]MBU2233803.1 hypothetical protein [Patescibacteria group bacterium]
MFNFFKKNKPESSEVIKKKVFVAPAISSLQDGQGTVLKELAKADNIVIHVMPEHFRNQMVKQDGAKTTGFMIIIGGVAVLLIASAALYYFLFRKPSVIITKEQPLVTENNQSGQNGTEVDQTATTSDNAIATGTAGTTLPVGDEIATTTIATTTSEITTSDTDISLRMGADSDNDGLTDIEEILLGAAASTADTDGDGYADGDEVINLYNPAGAGKLTANSNISFYENKTFAYDLLYPSTWQTSVNGGDDSVMFKTGDNQFMQIIIQPNVNKQSLDAWYIEQLAVLTINQADRVSGFTWQGIKSPDGLNIYLINKKQNYIFSLTYNPGDGKIVEYFNIFQMMIKSFTLKE